MSGTGSPDGPRELGLGGDGGRSGLAGTSGGRGDAGGGLSPGLRTGRGDAGAGAGPRPGRDGPGPGGDRAGATPPRLRGDAGPGAGRPPGAGPRGDRSGAGRGTGRDAPRPDAGDRFDRFFDRHEAAARAAPKGAAKRAIDRVQETDFFGDRNAARLAAARARGDKATEQSILRDRQERLDLARGAMADKDTHSVAHHRDLARAAEAFRNATSWKQARQQFGRAYEALDRAGELQAARVGLKGKHVHHMHFKALFKGETLNPHDQVVMNDSAHRAMHRATGGSPAGTNRNIFREMHHMLSPRPELRAQFRDYYYSFNKNVQVPLGRDRTGAGPADAKGDAKGDAKTAKSQIEAFNRAEQAAHGDRRGTREQPGREQKAERPTGGDRKASEARARGELKQAAEKEALQRAIDKNRHLLKQEERRQKDLFGRKGS